MSSPAPYVVEEVAQLGTATDAKVAVRIGRTPLAVAQRRFALGIPPAPRTGRLTRGRR